MIAYWLKYWVLVNIKVSIVALSSYLVTLLKIEVDFSNYILGISESQIGKFWFDFDLKVESNQNIPIFMLFHFALTWDVMKM